MKTKNKLPLTKKQYQTFCFIKIFTKKKGYCPSYIEIRKHFRLASNDSVWERINHLIKKDYIKHDKNTKRQLIIQQNKEINNKKQLWNIDSTEKNTFIKFV